MSAITGQTHGLNYSPDFINSLPVLQHRPPPYTPLRALSARQFAQIHLDYLSSHARDHSPSHVLFPFLHGLEGDNGAQNAFFTQNQAHCTARYASGGASADGVNPFPAPAKPLPPKFRGLIWVSSDDLPLGDMVSSDDEDIDELDSELDSLTEEDDSTSESSDSLVDAPMDIDIDITIPPPCSRSMTDEEVDAEMEMQLDPTLNGPVVNGCPPLNMSGEEKERLSLERPNLKTNVKKTDARAHVNGHAIRMTSGQLASPHSRVLSPGKHQPRQRPKPAVLTSSFKPWELLKASIGDGAGREGGARFVDLKVPGGISLRNFGIQVAIYATLSDIVVYSPRGATRSAAALAQKFKEAVEAKYEERRAQLREMRQAEEQEEGEEEELVMYNVFVLDATRDEMTKELDHLLMRMEKRSAGGGGAHTDGTDATTHGAEDVGRPNTVDFAMREKEEMRDLTRASEIFSVLPDNDGREEDEARAIDGLSGSSTSGRWEPEIGQVFLGNSSDVPLPPDRRFRVRSRVNSRLDANGSEEYEDEDEDEENPFDLTSNDPREGFGYDVCIECHDFAPFPSTAHLRAAEEHVKVLEKRWVERCLADLGDVDVDELEEWKDKQIPARPPPNASSVIHLPFPSSPAPSAATLNALMPLITLLERLLEPVKGVTVGEAIAQLRPPLPVQAKARQGMRRASDAGTNVGPRSLPPPNAFPTSFFVGNKAEDAVTTGRVRSTSATFLPSTLSTALSSSSSTSSVSGPSPSPNSTAPSFTTPSPTLLSSPPTQFSTKFGSNLRNNANTAPVPLRTRPLKVLIYSSDGYTESSVLALACLMALRRLSLPEAYLELQIEKRRSFFVYQTDVAVLRRIEGRCEREREREQAMINVGMIPSPSASGKKGRLPALSVSFAPLARPLRTQSDGDAVSALAGQAGRRPRASTVPTPERPIWGDHQAWFNDPRFDGSFPSRVLPFLYLGNLNHACNPYMLHALGITHVVSVGETALIKPSNVDDDDDPVTKTSPGPDMQANGNVTLMTSGPGGPGSLWIEQREGRIKVLDIQNICDDGIDSIEPWLEPICDWVDKAREEGGKVLIHCRVGVSRSATVVIAYVMKHLGLPLVDAYLIVRSRRLSVLIQPNVRLLYNLVGWEVLLAEQRAGQDKERLKNELSRCINWPYLAKQVHLLNEKYLH